MKRAALMVFLAACSFVGGLTAVLLPSCAAGPAWASPEKDVSAQDLLRISDRFETVARKITPTVVAVEATKAANSTRLRAVEESGSGVLIKMEGQHGVFVLTNNHVIATAAPAQITISLADNRILKPVQVLADPESDVAMLRLPEVENLSAAPLGDSDTTRVGQWVLAFGSPFGLNQTVTHGIISARSRGQVSLGNTIRIKDFLQTDAAINPGSSGGPLVNLDGEVIGINTAIASHSNSASGVAFSIPISLAKRVMQQLLEKGRVSRGYLGMQMVKSFEAGDALRLGLERAQGALIETVFPDTPAAAAGLQADDVVLKVNDTSIRNENHLINTITAIPAGRKVRLQVWCSRKPVNIDAVVGDWTQDQTRFRSVE